jgi:periplasmic protein TonB
MADPWVRPSSPGPPDSGVPSRPEHESRPTTGKTHSPDDYLLIDRLREDAALGRMDLDSVLSEATHAARYFSEATGAALALWSQGVVICRARSGEIAPPLGAKLEVDSGISGECLRSGRSRRCHDTLTDPLVDSRVCQELGIRSLAAVPLRGERGVVGILEVFSDRPGAFSDAHITLLKQLAQIAVTGRAQSVPVSPAPVLRSSPEPEVPVLPESLPPSWLTVLRSRMKGEEGQPLRLVAAGLLLMMVLGGFGWILNRGRGTSGKATRSVHAASAGAVPAAMAAAGPETTLTIEPSSGKRRRPSPLGPSSKAASDVMAQDVIRRASNTVVTDRNDGARSDGLQPANESETLMKRAAGEEIQAPDSAGLMAGTQGNTGEIPRDLLSTPPRLPAASLRMSQGISGGALTHRVSPTYPTQARLQRVEGPVVLDAVVGEDGNVHDVSVVSGNGILAAAAKQAVQQWRYQPFQLNGKPVSMHTEVKILFKLP